MISNISTDIIAGLMVLSSFFGFAEQPTFGAVYIRSQQLAASPVNTYVLTTDGTNNVWSAPGAGTSDGTWSTTSANYYKSVNNFFSTTSADYWETQQPARGGSSGFSTTSADYWKSVNNFFSTTSANVWSSFGLGFSTTSANYWKSVLNFFSTSSADYWYTQQAVPSGFSTTSANHWSTFGLAFSTTSSNYWKSVNNFFSTTSASYFSSLGLAWSTTSADYWETQQAARGGGGSGGGTWSTTTSQVSGQLVNYSNNTDDIVAIGAISTTTAEFWFDPNTTQASIGTGAAGDSSVTVGLNAFQWIFGFDDTDDSFAIASGTALGTNNALTISKGGLVSTSNSTSTLLTATTAWITNLFIGADTLAEYIADTAGAMVTGNTETDITVTYQDADNTIDFTVDTLPNLTGTLDIDSGGTGLTAVGASSTALLSNGSAALWQLVSFPAINGLLNLASQVTGTLAVGNGGTGATTLDNLITLATHTTGNYLATLSSSGSITVGNSGSENAAATVNLNMGNANTWTALQTFANSTSSLASFGYASSTLYYGAGLADCSGGNMLTWTSGRFGCEDDSTAAGAANDFSFLTTFNALHAATSSNLWLQGLLNASSTANISGTTTVKAALAVGTTTPATNALFSVGTSSPLIHINTVTGKTGFGAENNGPTRFTFGGGSNENLNPNIMFLCQDPLDARCGVSVDNKFIGLKSANGLVGLYTFDYTGGVGLDMNLLEFGGNIGIASSTPAARLAVQGSAYVSGTLFVGGAIIATSTIDFGDAISFEIPNGTANTVDAIGEIAFDTSDNQLILATSTNPSYPVVLPTMHRLWGATIASTSPDLVSGGRIWMPLQRDGFTVREIHCAVDAGTSVVVNLSNSGGTTDSETITCDADGATDTHIGTNPTYAAGSINSLEIGTVTGSVDYLTIAVYGFYTRE